MMKEKDLRNWKEKLSKDGFYLKRIKKNQTSELCEIAIRQNPLALKFVNERTLELCQLAVSLDLQALKFVPYNEETKGWYLDTLRDHLFFLPEVNIQSEALQWEYIRRYPNKLYGLKRSTQRIELEKAKRGEFYEHDNDKDDFEICYAVMMSDFAFGQMNRLECCKQLNGEERRELRLIAIPFNNAPLPLSLQNLLKDEYKRLGALYECETFSNKDQFIHRQTSEKFDFYTLLQSEPHVLGMINHSKRDYRSCRLAKRLDPLTQWHSPYHILEGLYQLNSK